ncbi:MAG: ferritin [Candidatus Cloacimonetes bacterium]|nr:ferritin [Candidatus Cloacimonadota bacterium]
MKISAELAQEINDQINKELFSEYYYLSMAAYLESENLPGFANFFVVQAQEEHFHAMKFYQYLNERGARVHLEAIEKPKSDFESALEVFELAYEHEVFVSELINKLMDIAISDKDHASKGFLQWFVDEQVEEESSMEGYINHLNRIGDNSYGILMLDKELAGRVFTPPATTQN